MENSGAIAGISEVRRSSMLILNCKKTLSECRSGKVQPHLPDRHSYTDSAALRIDSYHVCHLSVLLYFSATGSNSQFLGTLLMLLKHECKKPAPQIITRSPTKVDFVDNCKTTLQSAPISTMVQWIASRRLSRTRGTVHPTLKLGVFGLTLPQFLETVPWYHSSHPHGSSQKVFYFIFPNSYSELVNV